MNRAQRDLIWCLNSPSLIRPDTNYCIWPTDEWFSSLSASGREAPITPRHVHHFRLGQHFEKIMFEWITHQQQFHLLAGNLQVQHHKRTIGEFDLIISNQEVTEHWELAIKFYLGRGDGSELNFWFGPNTADRFDIKLDRLCSHQLRLGEGEEAKKLLSMRGIRLDRVRCIVKGRMFYPWKQFQAGHFRFPDRINPTHPKGWWLPVEDFRECWSDSDQHFVYLQKIHWLSRITNEDNLPALSLDEMLALIGSATAEQATHLALIDPEGNEISRGFVVTRQWLDRYQ